jgi:trimeric autotransporter adhesin
MIRSLDFRWAVVVPILLASSGCGGSPSTPTTPSTQVSLVSVAVTGAASLTGIGETGQLVATATMSDGTTQTVTSAATWQSSNQNVVTISNTGLATAVGAGQATVTATTQARSGTLAMTVSVAPAATTFQGTIAGGSGQSGTFTVTIQTAISATAHGKIHPLASAATSGTVTLINGNSVFTIAGTFDSLTNAINLSGGGFVFTGTIRQGAASGTYTGPGGTSGGFSGLDSTRNIVTVMCGSYSGSNTGNGIWNLQFSASGAASGVTRPDLSARDPQPRTTLLVGQLSGSTLTLRSVEDGATATGAVQGQSVAGTHDDGRGTFTGSTAACR